MRIFLTGATGFIGTNLMVALLEAGHELVVLVRAPNKAIDKAIAEQRIKNRLRFLGCGLRFYQVVLGDITESGLGIREDIGTIDEVWHAAGCISFDAAQRLLIQEVNFGGTKNVLAFCEQIEAERFFHLSSAYVCGKREGEILEDDLYLGQDFNNSYEFTKFLAEEAVRQWTAQTGIPGVIFRPSIVAGHSVHGRTLHFFGYYRYMRGIFSAAQMIRKWFKITNGPIDLPIRMLGDANTLVNIAPVDYLVDLMVKIAKAQKHKTRGLEIYHVVNPNPESFYWWTKTSAEALDIFGLQPGGIQAMSDLSDSNDKLKELEFNVNFSSVSYLPYVSAKRHFDQANVRAILGDIPRLVVDEATVRRWMWFAQSLGFHEQRLRLDAASSPQERKAAGLAAAAI